MRYIPKKYDAFDDMFESFFPTSFKSENMMKTDIFEKDGFYNLDVELPGYKKEDVSMEIMDGYLTIKASHNMSDEEKDSKGNLVRQERYFGSCSRSFYVGDNLTANDISAKFADGMLKITLPSREQKRIQSAQPITIE